MLDEGGAVITGVFPGVPGRIAVVGLAEKGTLELELSTSDAGGHASAPQPGGATARLARAAVLSRSSREGNALVRTTVAVTQLEGSRAPNVLANRARAHANIRIALGETVASTVERVRRGVDDPSVSVRVASGNDPSPVSRTDNAAYALVGEAVRAVYPDATVTPYVMVQASDARHFAQVSDSVYRFMPFDLSREELATIHAADERLSVAALGRGIGFYRHLIAGA